MKINPPKIHPNERIARGMIEEGPVLPCQWYGRDKGKSMLVTSYGVKYLPRDGAWVADGLTLYGQVIKKDNTPGKHTGYLYYSNPATKDGTPQWVKDFAEFYRPKEPAPTSPDEALTLRLDEETDQDGNSTTPDGGHGEYIASMERS